MQVEPVGLATIEFVSPDGASESEGMGRMNPQLMSASGERIKGDKRL